MQVQRPNFVKIMVLGAIIALFATFPAAAQETVATNTAMALAVKKVPPDFPAAARQLNVTGASEVQVHVDAAGNVTEAKVLKGNAMFSANSMAAARQWKFTPHTKDGAPVAFTTVLIFNFSK